MEGEVDRKGTHAKNTAGPELNFCRDSVFSSNLVKHKRIKRNKGKINIQQPAVCARNALEMHGMESVLQNIESSLVAEGNHANKSNSYICKEYSKAKHVEDNTVCSHQAYIGHVKFEREEMTRIVKQPEGKCLELGRWSTMQPWINSHFTRSYDSVAENVVDYAGRNSVNDVVMRRREHPSWQGGDNYENDISTDDETFFSCTERNFNTRESNYCMSAPKDEEILYKNVQEYLEKCKSPESLQMDRATTKQASVELVAAPSVHTNPSRCLPFISLTSQGRIRANGSRKNFKSQQAMLPVAHFPVARSSSIQLKGESVAFQVNSIASSTHMALPYIDRPLAIYPSRKSLSIISVVSCSQSSKMVDDIQPLPSQSQVSFQKHQKTGSLLGEIMGSDSNSILTAFLNGIPLIDYANSDNCKPEKPAVFKFDRPLRDIQDDTVAAEQDSHCEEENTSAVEIQDYNRNQVSDDEQDATRQCQGSTISSPKFNYSVEAIPKFQNIHTKRPVSKHLLPDLKATDSSSAMMPMPKSLTGSQPQIHTSCGKTFLPPELSDIEDMDDYWNNCKFTLVKKTIFKPTRARPLPHERLFSPVIPDSSSVSAATSKVSMTTPISSLTSTSTLVLGGGQVNIRGSRSVLQVSGNSHMRKVNIPGNKSCNLIKGKDCKNGMEDAVSSNTKKELGSNTVSVDFNKQIENMESVAKDCSFHTAQGVRMSPVPQALAKADTMHSPSFPQALPNPSRCATNARKAVPRYNSEGCTLASKTLPHQNLQKDAPNLNPEVKLGKNLKSKMKKAVFRLFRSQNV